MREKNKGIQMRGMKIPINTTVFGIPTPRTQKKKKVEKTMFHN